MNREQLDNVKALKEKQQAKTKDKKFDKLTRADKDELLETIAKMLGLIKE